MSAMLAMSAMLGSTAASELGLVGLAAAVARPVVAVAVLAAGSRVLPPLAGAAVTVAVALWSAPLATGGQWSALAGLPPEALAVELVRGLLLGLGALAPLWAAHTAGLWAGQRWRLGGASSASPVAALMTALFGVAFVAVDGPALLCAAIARSYAAAPLGAPLQAAALASHAFAVAEWLAAAVRLSLPILLTVAVAELAVAAATRAAAATAVAWPSSVVAPTLALWIAAPMVPLLVGAMATLLRRGLGG